MALVRLSRQMKSPLIQTSVLPSLCNAIALPENSLASFHQNIIVFSIGIAPVLLKVLLLLFKTPFTLVLNNIVLSQHYSNCCLVYYRVASLLCKSAASLL